MNEIDAKELALRRVNELARAASDDFELLEDATVQVEGGWVFFYNSADYVRTKDPIHALAGNGPLFVSHEGRVTELITAIPWQQALAGLLKSKKPGPN